MRVVLDTNILVSALITKGTPPDQLYQAWLRNQIELVTSIAQISANRRSHGCPDPTTIAAHPSLAAWYCAFLFPRNDMRGNVQDASENTLHERYFLDPLLPLPVREPRLNFGVVTKSIQ